MASQYLAIFSNVSMSGIVSENHRSLFLRFSVPCFLSSVATLFIKLPLKFLLLNSQFDLPSLLPPMYFVYLHVICVYSFFTLLCKFSFNLPSESAISIVSSAYLNMMMSFDNKSC